MLRIATIINIGLSATAIGFAIFILQMSGAMIHHSHFEFFQTVPDEDRRHIFAQAAAVMRIGLVPLLLSNVGWIAIGYVVLARDGAVKSDDVSSP